MSKALKCDRCKKCFDPYMVQGEEYFTSIRDLFCQDGRAFSNNEVSYRDEELHLCPDCSRIFSAFMADGPADVVPVEKEKKKDENEQIEEFARQAEQIVAILRCFVNAVLYSTDNNPDQTSGQKKRSGKNMKDIRGT